MTTRNIEYENKFRKYLYSGSIERYREICKNINVKSNQEGVQNETNKTANNI